MGKSKKRAAEDVSNDAKKVKTSNDLLKSVDIQSIMTAEGPIVKCVLLKADGSTDEVSVDMTPSKQQVKALLGGACHFLGQYEDIEVFLMCNPDHQESDSIPLTQHKLQPPFHGRLGKIHGDILLFRTDSSGDHQHFTADEYTKFLELDLPEWEPESEEDDSDVDPEDEAGYKKAALAYFVEDFVEQNGRQPTEAEIEEITKKVDEEMAAEDDPQVAALEYFVMQFKEEHDRDPTNAEIAELKEKVAIEMEKLVVSDEEDDEQDIGELIKELHEQACARFLKETGKEVDPETEQAILKNVTRIALTLQGDNQGMEGDDEVDDEDVDDEGDEEDCDEENDDEAETA